MWGIFMTLPLTFHTTHNASAEKHHDIMEPICRILEGGMLANTHPSTILWKSSKHSNAKPELQRLSFTMTTGIYKAVPGGLTFYGSSDHGKEWLCWAIYSSDRLKAHINGLALLFLREDILCHTLSLSSWHSKASSTIWKWQTSMSFECNSRAASTYSAQGVSTHQDGSQLLQKQRGWGTFIEPYQSYCPSTAQLVVLEGM